MSEVPREGAAGRRAAADALRSLIMNGDVAPGQRLVELELAGVFGVTRAAMRAALIDLAAEGVVQHVPNRGARVRMMSVEEAVAVTECRMALEGLCAAKAAQRATDEQIDVLVELGHAMRAAVEAGEPTKYSALNRELDVMIQEIAGQPVAAELLRRLHGQVVRHQFRLAIRPGRSQVSLPEHLAVIDAIARRDADGAEAATRSHLRGVIAALRENENGRR